MSRGFPSNIVTANSAATFGGGMFKPSEYLQSSFNGTWPGRASGLTPAAAALNGRIIYQNYPNSPSGVYWLKTPSGTTYQAYIKMDYGGGWVNLNTTLGPYTTALTSSWGTGGGNQLSGATGNPVGPLNASYVTNNQAVTYSCPSYPYRSMVTGNSSLLSDLGATQVRWKFSVGGHSGVTCGFINSGQSGLVVISGTNNNFAVCTNPPNSYSDVNPSSFTAEGYATITNTDGAGCLFAAYTACGGTMNVTLSELYVR